MLRLDLPYQGLRAGLRGSISSPERARTHFYTDATALSISAGAHLFLAVAVEPRNGGAKQYRMQSAARQIYMDVAKFLVRRCTNGTHRNGVANLFYYDG